MCGSNAEAYGIDEDDIAVVGFSAGGILCGELLLHSDGYLLPDEIDENYIPDSLDYVSAEASAIGHVYSFYGRLSVSDNDVDTLARGRFTAYVLCLRHARSRSIGSSSAMQTPCARRAYPWRSTYLKTWGTDSGRAMQAAIEFRFSTSF